MYYWFHHGGGHHLRIIFPKEKARLNPSTSLSLGVPIKSPSMFPGGKSLAISIDNDRDDLTEAV